MSNHYHLVVETPEANLSSGMRQLNGIYTQRVNNMHGLGGHVYQGRYKAILIDKDNYLLELCRYVVLKPVRANLVELPEHWKWGSCKATAGVSKVYFLAMLSGRTMATCFLKANINYNAKGFYAPAIANFSILQ